MVRSWSHFHAGAAVSTARGRTDSSSEDMDCSPTSFSSSDGKHRMLRGCQCSEQHPPGGPGCLPSAPPLSRPGAAEAQHTQSSGSTGSACPQLWGHSPALPPTAMHGPHIPQGISSAAGTALVVTPYVLACHPAPMSLKMNGLLRPRAGRREGVRLLNCLQSKPWLSQVLSSAEPASPRLYKGPWFRHIPAPSCFVSARSFLPPPTILALDPADRWRQRVEEETLLSNTHTHQGNNSSELPRSSAVQQTALLPAPQVPSSFLSSPLSAPHTGVTRSRFQSQYLCRKG